MNKRGVICIAMLMLYAIAYSFYIYELPQPYFTVESLKVFINCINMIMVIFFVVDLKSGIWDILHKQFNLTCILAVIMNYILTILTHLQVISDPIKIFCTMDGSILVTSAMILFFGYKYDYINQDYENDGQP